MSASAEDYVETKLDLATAYLEMGDPVGARTLLEEVLQEGNVKQKERAEEFMAKLP
jgi:pilus assembly protein FimV